MNLQPTILIVDDEKRLSRTLEILFREEGPFATITASDYYSALEKLKQPVDLVLTDLTMPGKSGLDLLRAIRHDFPKLPVILMTAYSTVQSAVDAMKDGAIDYIVKPFENDKLLEIIRKSLRNHGVSTPPPAQTLLHNDRFGDLIGKSLLMQTVYDRIQRVSETDSTVLITGESGTGKELVAKAIHFSGSRKAKPFIALNCTAVPETLLESELFGHEKGAFTGAIRQREGKFELAHSGTLFLDEIGDMALPVQSKLLRVIQEKEFVRVGGDKTIKVDVRIIAATNRDLEKAVLSGQFREDLFYRLNVVVIELPPLRKRREDLPVLIEHFLKEKSRRNSVPTKQLTQEARLLLIQYEYPGNVRELENIIERAVVMSKQELLTAEDFVIRKPLNKSLESMTLPVDGGIRQLDEIREKLERDVIERAIHLHPQKSNTELAELLGTTRRILETRIKEYGIEKPIHSK